MILQIFSICMVIFIIIEHGYVVFAAIFFFDYAKPDRFFTTISIFRLGLLKIDGFIILFMY